MSVALLRFSKPAPEIYDLCADRFIQGMVSTPTEAVTIPSLSFLARPVVEHDRIAGGLRYTHIKIPE